MLSNVELVTHAKWILAGEHAVLRGHPALVFPVASKKLTLQYNPDSHELNADFFGDNGADLHLLFWSVLEQGMHQLGQSINTLRGHFTFHSNIPIGAGLGASAALCVATAQWFITQQLLDQSQLLPFAIQLEHLFHGKSSGLDIAGVIASEGIEFQQGRSTPINPAWSPQWYLSSCGQIGITSHCIQQVQTIWNKDIAIGEHLDQQMRISVQLAREALTNQSPEALEQLAHAINLASDCFQQWGLISDSLQKHMQILKEAGAIAAKPTGSGGGGFVLSLWNQSTIPDNLGLVCINPQIDNISHLA